LSYNKGNKKGNKRQCPARHLRIEQERNSMMDEIASFGTWLRRRRKALDLTQAELADRAGCAPGTIKSIEGDARRPSKQLAERLAECLGLGLDERGLFLKAARAELSADRLASPTYAVARAVGMNTAQPAASADRHTLPGGTITFLFTDIEGSTGLWEQHPRVMRSALARHDAILTKALASHHGVLVKNTGDGILAAFAHALGALNTALEAQRAFQSEDWGAINRLHVRMALHTGVAEARAGDYNGPALNRTARLLAAGHGGQILLSRAVVELLHDHLPGDLVLRDLGVHLLKDLSRPEHIYQLVAPDLPTQFPTLRTLDARPNNLPAQATALLGRERDVSTVVDLLRREQVRLLTLTGPGGTGKTRLALQAGAELLGVFADGVWFVDLAPIHDPEIVITTIAQTLGVKEIGSQPLIEQLSTYLRPKQLLLLLDNFEQVVDAAPQVADLLTAAPQVTILVTSRIVLHLRGEKEYVVLPLALPDPKALPSSYTLSQYAAVALFIQRAQDVKLDFQVTNENAPAVAEICHRLDGLPLAIELAAARIKLFAPELLLKRLEQRLSILIGGPRDAPTRQQTIRSTIDWSYQLLDEGEQALFARLGVFVGGCTLEAIEAVCNVDGDLPTNVVEGVSALTDKSLLRQTEGVNGEPRFVMLETIREYALERLAESSDAPTIRLRHAEYYLALAEGAEPQLLGREQHIWLDRLEREYSNLRAALAWSQTVPSDRELNLRLAGILSWFWYFCGYLSEGYDWLEGALAKTNRESILVDLSAVRAKALYGAGLLALEQDDYAMACARLEESVALYQKQGDKRGEASALNALGDALLYRGDYTAARELEETSVILWRDVGEEWGLALALHDLGKVMRFQGDYFTARMIQEESMILWRNTGNPWGLALAFEDSGILALFEGDYTVAQAELAQAVTLSQGLRDKHRLVSAHYGLGDIARLLGDYRQASLYYEEGLRYARELGAKRDIAFMLANLGHIALHQDNDTQAIALFNESLMLFHHDWDKSCIAVNLAGLGGVARVQNQLERAARLLGAAGALQDGIEAIILWPVDRADYECNVAAVRVQLDDATFATAWIGGQAMALEQAIAYALEE
jgi:predicted ATPase/class 3 adenylate cyclase